MPIRTLPSKVIVCGGGLAGPAMAIALARHSIKSILIERRPHIDDIGGVIFLAPNAMRVMDKILGVEPQLRERGYTFDAIHVHVQSGESLVHAGGFAMAEKTGIAGITIARPVLHEVLVEEAKRLTDMVEVRYDARLEKVEEDERGVTAILRGGDRIEGDLLIGCDGIGSDVRKHVLGDRNPAPEYSGIVFVGCIVPTPQIKVPKDLDFPAFIYNPHGAFLSFAMDQANTSLQWGTSLAMPERDRKTGWKEYVASGQVVEDMRAEYSDTKVEPIRSFVDSLTKDNCKLWAPYSIPPLPTWHTARVCILGDAAHAIPPSLGQGSAMAFEDVALLSRLLGDPESVAQGYDNLFEFFEQTRKVRCDKIKKMAEGAEGSRRPTKNGLMWWAKTSVARFVLWAFGKEGYLSGSDVITYDITKEPLNVASVKA